MTRRVLKFRIPLLDTQVIQMPRNADVISAQWQAGVGMCLWAICDSTVVEERHVTIVGTGHPLPNSASASGFIGSVHTGGFVWHVFVEKTAWSSCNEIAPHKPA